MRQRNIIFYARPHFGLAFLPFAPQSVVRAPHLSPKRFHSLDIFIAFHLFDIYFSACSFLFILFKPPTNMMKKSKLKSVERKFLRYLGLVWKIQYCVPIFFLFIIHFRHTQPNTNRKAFEYMEKQYEINSNTPPPPPTTTITKPRRRNVLNPNVGIIRRKGVCVQRRRRCDCVCYIIISANVGITILRM